MIHRSILPLLAFSLVISCTVCMEEDASFVDENGDDAVRTVIGAAIDGTRITLGDADGKTYPLLWQTGDKVVVNGAVSNALKDSDYDGQSARFAFVADVAAPYKAVYPASAVKLFSTEARLRVPFAQEYVPGSFDPSAGIMLGTGEDKVAFCSAMAFLKFRTTGAAGVKISRLEVTSLGTEPMAGDFVTKDFSTISPDASGNTFQSVAVIPSSPVEVGAEFIVAIPAQAYADGIKVTLQTPEGEAMQKKSFKSFEAVPGKMYATSVEFVPGAVEGTIVIDGDLSDWKAVPTVSYSLAPGDAPLYNIIKMSLTADDDYVYGYVEMDETYPNYGTFMDIFVDADGNPATGGKPGSLESFGGNPYTAAGLEWYIEGGTFYGDILQYGDSFAKYKYYGADGASVFSSLTNESSSVSSGQFALKGVSNGRGLGRFEFKMSRSRFDLCGPKAALGIKNIVQNKAVGLLPQGPSNGGDFERTGMGTIAMKECRGIPVKASGPISIDGNFDDWDAPGVVTVSRTDQMALKVLKTAKFYADEEYLYVYFEIDKARQFGSKSDFNVMMDFYIDNDENPLNGGFRSNMYSRGFKWYYETFVGDANGFSNWGSGQLEYVGPDGGWGVWNDHGGEYAVKTAGAYDSGNDFGRVEARLGRADFQLTGSKAAVGIVLLDGSEGWAAMGMLPQGPATDPNDHSTRQVVSLLEIDLPALSDNPRVPSVSGEPYDYTATMAPERPYIHDYTNSMFMKMYMAGPKMGVDSHGNICSDGTYVNMTYTDVIEGLRQIDIISRGMKKVVYLVGWQFNGHDDKYPAFYGFNPALKRPQDALARDSFLWCQREAKKYNADVSVHINMNDAHADSPYWQYYVDNDLLCRNNDGSLYKWGVKINGLDNVQVCWVNEWELGQTAWRMDQVMDLCNLKEVGTVHIDAFQPHPSPYHGYSIADAERVERKIYRYFRDQGVDVTSEFWKIQKRDHMYGLQPAAWWDDRSFSERLALPASLACGGVMGTPGGSPNEVLSFLFGANMQGETRFSHNTDFDGLKKDFCEQTLLFVYMNGHSVVSGSESQKRVQYSDGLVADYPSRRIYKGDLVLRDGGDVFCPALWITDHKEILAYSENGYSLKTWTLPSDWNGVKKVKMYTVTKQGLTSEKTLTVEGGKMTMSLSSGQMVSIQAIE